MNKIYRALLIVILIFSQLNVYSTVLGPIVIDIIGYDSSTNIIYFAQTNWADCDCETDLFKYNISNDSIEIISNWAKRYNFSKNKNEVIKEKGLDYLFPIDSLSEGSLFLFAWLPKVAYYSPVIMKDTVNCPFQILISNKKYNYTQCYSQNYEPLIKEFKINNKVGLILIKYTGDCIEGNTIDRLIFYQRDKNGIQSRELILEDKLSID